MQATQSRSSLIESTGSATERVERRADDVWAFVARACFVSALPSWDRLSATDMPRGKNATNRTGRQSRNSCEIACSVCVRQICLKVGDTRTKLFAEIQVLAGFRDRQIWPVLAICCDGKKRSQPALSSRRTTELSD